MKSTNTFGVQFVARPTKSSSQHLMILCTHYGEQKTFGNFFEADHCSFVLGSKSRTDERAQGADWVSVTYIFEDFYLAYPQILQTVSAKSYLADLYAIENLQAMSAPSDSLKKPIRVPPQKDNSCSFMIWCNPFIPKPVLLFIPYKSFQKI